MRYTAVTFMLGALLSYSVTLAVYLKYPLIFLGTTIGGPFLILASGFFIHEGLLDIVPLFLAISLGELVLDIMWYYLGHFYVEKLIGRFGHTISLTPELFAKIKALFVKYDVMILFVSKLLMGLGMGIAILITAGASKIHFWKYMLWNAIGEVIWVSVMLYIGYFYAGLYTGVAESEKILFLVSTVVIVGALGFGASKFVKDKVISGI